MNARLIFVGILFLVGCAGGYQRDTLPSDQTSDPFGGLLNHQSEVISIIQKNAVSNCEATIKNSKDYLDRNQSDIAVLQKRYEEQKQAMAEDQQKDFRKEMLQRSAKILDRYREPIVRFIKSCGNPGGMVFADLIKINSEIGNALNAMGVPIPEAQ